MCFKVCLSHHPAIYIRTFQNVGVCMNILTLFLHATFEASLLHQLEFWKVLGEEEVSQERIFGAAGAPPTSMPHAHHSLPCKLSTGQQTQVQKALLREQKLLLFCKGSFYPWRLDLPQHQEGSRVLAKLA